MQYVTFVKKFFFFTYFETVTMLWQFAMRKIVCENIGWKEEMPISWLKTTGHRQEEDLTTDNK